MNKLAIIDLGSNSIRMSIFDTDKNGNYFEKSNYRNMIKLSEGMTPSMKLQPEAQLRAVTAMLQYKDIINRDKVTQITAVATAAVRKAINKEEFLEMLRRETGIDVEVIDGQKEAYFDFLAVKSKLGSKCGVICDIGGGSTELIDVSGDSLPKAAVSVPIGSRHLTEMFFKDGETDEGYAKAFDYVMTRFKNIKWLSEVKNVPIIGIGGTMRAIAKYDLKDNSKSAVEKHEISTDKTDCIFKSIRQASADERVNMAGIGRERADIIPGGMIPLMCLKEIISATKLVVADVGVRDGILFDMIRNNA